MHCRIGESMLPVLSEVEVVVVGGSFAGISCALELSKSGKSVVVIESRTYLGQEMTATLRPWVSVTEKEENTPDLIVDILKNQKNHDDFTNNHGHYKPLHMARLKTSLEDILLDSGIDLLYASLPIGIEKDENTLTGLIIANKSGRQLIRCQKIVDVTETALVANICGENVSGTEGNALFQRTLEFVGLELNDVDEQIIVPKELGIFEDKVQIRSGYRGAQHAYVQFSLNLPSKNTSEANSTREIESRKQSMNLVHYLVNKVSAFCGATLCATSNELFGPIFCENADEKSKGALKECSLKNEPPQSVWSLYLPLYQNNCGGIYGAEKAAAIGKDLAQIVLSGCNVKNDMAENSENNLVLPELESDQEILDMQAHLPLMGLGDKWEQYKVCGTSIPVVDRFDVLVVGGGSSGASSAIVAANEGMKTLLIDMNPGLGGTGTYGGVDSYWFGREIGYAEKIHNEVLRQQELIGYSGSKWNIESKIFALLSMAIEKEVNLAFNAITFGAVAKENRVTGVIVATRWGPKIYQGQVVIDATGDGDVAAFAGAEFVYGSEKDHTTMWFSLAQYESPDKIQNNFTSMVDVSNVVDYTRAILSGRRRGNDCHDHGVYVAARESRHIVGDTSMKLTDQLLHRKYNDVINIHFSNHDVKGVSGADWINVGLIPPNLTIEIPYSILLPKGLDGILLAGKAISATHDALPAIRMQADLENLGAVVALAASIAIKTNKNPRVINVTNLQTRLIQEGLLPNDVLERELTSTSYSDKELEVLADSIESDEPLYEYSNMEMSEAFQDKINFVEICSVGKKIIPFLERALEQAEGLKKIHIAQALSMLGSQAGVQVLVDRIMEDLDGEKLPTRTSNIMYVQLPPDHGAMPDSAYLLYSLAEARDERSIPVWNRVAGLVNPIEEDFKNRRQGLYYFVDAIAQGAERLGSEKAIPALKVLHQIPYLSNQQLKTGYQADYFLERRAMLEVALGRAMAKCGSAEGYRVLISYLSDSRATLAKQALQQLELLTGCQFGNDPKKWWDLVRENQSILKVHPDQFKLDFEENSANLLR